MPTNELERELCARAAAWITDERNRWREHATPLPDLGLLAHFKRDTIERARFVLVDALPSMSFATEFSNLPLPDLDGGEAITFNDTILIRKTTPITRTLLVHEMAHVVQYAILGIEAFTRIYTRSWLQTMRYERIILEQHAFGAEIMARTDPRAAVEDHITMLTQGIHI